MNDRTPRILVVDDEPMNIAVIKAMLTPLGYDIVEAVDGIEALEAVKRERPDVVLMDIRMPRMDGLEATRLLKEDEATRIIPVVMVTAHMEREYRVRAIDAGADDFLSKPVDKMELRARVQSLLKVKAYHDHLMDDQRVLEAQVALKTMELSDAMQELQAAMERLKAASLDTILRLTRAAEYRDDDTGEHVLRMSHYSTAIARQMGLPDDVAELLLHAAPMHDIGKIGIPDRILLKEGKLTDDEWDLMRRHTSFGAQILDSADAEVIKLGQVIARTHHERWNGSGYPRGLQGEEIPLVGRIVAVADVFDALLSDRPYKKAFSVQKSLAIIAKDAGSHFDPDVVDAFFEVRAEVLDIKDRFKEQGHGLLWKFAVEEATDKGDADPD